MRRETAIKGLPDGRGFAPVRWSPPALVVGMAQVTALREKSRFQGLWLGESKGIASAVSKTPPPNPLPATERGSKPNSLSSSPPLLVGEGVGGRGFRHSRLLPVLHAFGSIHFSCHLRCLAKLARQHPSSRPG